MKKVIAFVVMLVLVATMTVAAMGEHTIRETVLTETKIEEKAPVETTEEETELQEKKHREPNYVVTIGGDRMIRVEVNHHPVVVQKTIDGCKWVGNKVSSGYKWVKHLFVNEDDEV